MLKNLLDRPQIFELYIARNSDGKLIAGSAFIKGFNNLFYWFNANDYENRNLKANYLILASVIEKYKELDYLNLGYSHNKGIENFKKAWGSQLIKYYIVERKVI